MRRFPRPIYLGISVVLLLTSGCATKAGWQYVPNPGRPAGVQVPLVVAVERFQDERGSSNSRYFWLCIIPLVPYCSSSYSQPENANGFLTEAAYNFRPSDDLAEATTIELRQTGMFKDVFVTNRISDPTAQLTVRGTIDSTQWDGSEYSYLLGPYGSLLWIFGLPIGSAQNNLQNQIGAGRKSHRAAALEHRHQPGLFDYRRHLLQLRNGFCLPADVSDRDAGGGRVTGGLRRAAASGLVAADSVRERGFAAQQVNGLSS